MLIETVARNLRIVMVETSHPGNIGATARAMKNMGQHRLYLVNPAIFPSSEATARATGADDILEQAVICQSLQDAVQDCAMVVATTARQRTVPWPERTPRECAVDILTTTQSEQVAIVFGRENSGLNNHELELCNLVLRIPTVAYSSLNVSAAVLLICYEIMEACRTLEPEVPVDPRKPLATMEQMQFFYEYLEECMQAIGYYAPQVPHSIMRKIKRLFNKAQMDRDEMNILRGFLAAMREAVQNKKDQ